MKAGLTIWLSAALLCGAAGGPAGATEGAAGRALPALALADQDGSPADDAALRTGGRSVLLVVDAGRPRTQAALAMLEAAPARDGVQILALGDAAAFHALQLRYRRLDGVRWWRDADGAAMRALRLPGLPALLGIDAQGRIAWQSTGMPAAPSTLRAQVAAWLAGERP